ncbi:hypothetical protein, partial [Klebsiella pneumoniae]|uniref:hypothetical protein n=1 Tax=Klebsiella pneumoniae TaxID=573 RepID=UPI001C4E009E
VYCAARDIPTDNIRLSQNNIVDPENRYKQIFKIQVELPADISEKDRQGILRSIDRCTVKKVIQTGPEFVIEEQFWGEDIANAEFVHYPDEKWFQPGPNGELPAEVLDEHTREIYDPEDELLGIHL